MFAACTTTPLKFPLLQTQTQHPLPTICNPRSGLRQCQSVKHQLLHLGPYFLMCCCHWINGFMVCVDKRTLPGSLFSPRRKNTSCVMIVGNVRSCLTHKLQAICNTCTLCTGHFGHTKLAEQHFCQTFWHGGRSAHVSSRM